MSFTIKNGTPTRWVSRCSTCRFAHIQLGYQESEHAVRCEFSSPAHAVTFAVRECTDYSDKNVPTRYEMEEMAWVISDKKAAKPVGFHTKQAGATKPTSLEDEDE